MRATLYDLISEEARRRDEIAFSHRPRLRRHSWSYRQISLTANQIARELEFRGVGRGDRVLIFAENSPEWVAVFHALILLGAIAVPLDPQSATDFVKRVRDKTEPKLLLVGREVESPDLDIPLLFLAALPETAGGRSAEPIHRSSPTEPTDTVEIIFTSGTTAEPKGVILTHENLLANLEPMEREIGKYIRWKFIVDPIKILCLLPLSHVFGQMMGIFLPKMLGAEVVFQSRLNPSEIIGTIKRERVMIAAVVPRILETLKSKIEREYESRGESTWLRHSMEKERSWPAAMWRYRRVHRMFGYKFLSFVTGGATLEESTESFWRRLGYAVVQGYGMTETAALVSLNNPFSARRGSLGQILAGQENIRIGDGGEIMVRGKNISPGYWGEAAARESSEWLPTGDVGELDETGRLYFKGRKKDVIVTAAGLKVYPVDLETALNEQPEMIASAVVGFDGPGGPEPYAALVLRPGSNATEVIARANAGLADFQRIRRWIEWPDVDLPRTATHKVRKNLIVEAIADKERAVIGSAVSGVAAAITKVMSVGKGNLRPDARLGSDLALDSLARVELMSAIEDRYQIDLDERSFNEATTVQDIEKMVRGDEPTDNDAPRFEFPTWPLKFPVSWIRPVFYELVIYPITRILGRVDRRGRDNLDGVSMPVLFAANHVTYVDPALVMSAMPAKFRRNLAIAMDGERLRAYLHPPSGIGIVKRIRWFFTYWLAVTFFNVFPLPRQSGFRRSFEFAGEAMDRGYNVLIFPEGELTKDGEIGRFRAGIGILAAGLEAAVVPVAITGLYKLRASGQRGFAPPGIVNVGFGEPVQFESEQPADEIAHELEGRIRKLAAEVP